MGNQQSAVHRTDTQHAPEQSEVLDRLLSLMRSNDWKHDGQSRSEHEPCEKLSTELTNHAAMRATRTIKGNVDAVARALLDLDQMPKFDHDLNHIDDVVQPNGTAPMKPEVELKHFVLKKFNPLTKPRDFGVFYTYKADVAGYDLVMAFTEAGDFVPHVHGHIRGACHAYGFFLKADGLERTTVTILMCFDINGWLPNSLADHAGPATFKIMDELEKHLAAGSATGSPSHEQQGAKVSHTDAQTHGGAAAGELHSPPAVQKYVVAPAGLSDNHPREHEVRPAADLTAASEPEGGVDNDSLGRQSSGGVSEDTLRRRHSKHKLGQATVGTAAHTVLKG